MRLLHPRRLQDYAMGEPMDAAEQAAVERHLAGCPRCRREVAAMRQALATAVQTLPTVTPTAEARRRSLEAAAAALAAQRREAAPSLSGGVKAQRPAARWAMPALAFAVVGLLALGAIGLERQARWQAAESERALVAAWLTRNDVVTKPLPAPSGGRSPGTVMVAEDGVVLVVLRSAAPGGMGYQVWGQTSLGSGSATVPVSLGLTQGTVLRLDAADYTHLSISIEPRRGSSSPTTLVGRVPLKS